MADLLTPKLRNEVTTFLRHSGGRPAYIIKDQRTGVFFRCGETEKFITDQCDGVTPAEMIRRRTEERFNATLSPDMFQSFLQRLDDNGLLESGRRHHQRPGRIGGNLLYLRFKAVDPNAFFDRVEPAIRFFFTKQFAIISAFSIAAATAIFASQWNGFSQSLTTIYQISSVPLIMLVVFSVIALHECAHGLTCKHFGGSVHEMGFMLLYFQPALYCNVSDAWLFPDRSKRLWVSFAGPYCELFLWSLAVMVWSVTVTESWVNHVALIVAASSGIKTLLNFNPFIKLDGYYLLSDLLDIPNLRKKSFRHVGNRIRKIVGAGYPEDDAMTRREKRIFLLYGSLATIGSFAFLTYALLTLGDFLIEHKQPAAFMMVVGLLGIRFRRKFRRLFGGVSDDEDESAAQKPSDGNGKREQRRKKRSVRRMIIWIGAVLSFGAILFFVPVDPGVAGPFVVLPVHNADLRSQVDGIIEEIYVTEGDRISRGDLIARFSGRENRTEFRKISEQIRQARAKLRMLEKGPTEEEIALAKNEVEKGKEHVKYAHSRLERNRTMFEKDLISLREFEDTQELAAIAEMDLASAQGRLDVLTRGARPEEIEAAKAEIAALQTQQRYLSGQLERLELRSSVDGTIATPARQLKEMVHQSLPKGTLVVKVYDFSSLTAEIAVPEYDIGDVDVGQEVALRVRAYPLRTFFGTVVSVAVAASPAAAGSTGSTASAGGGKTILVTTRIDNRELLLKPEMTGQAKIYSGEKSIAEYLMRKVIRTIKIDLWSIW